MADPTIFQPRGGILPRGTRLNGIYEIEAPIASGGMGEVYRGREVQTGEPVAIKVIRTDLGDNGSALALFRREATALNRLHHEAIVRYYVFSLEPVLQRHYLAMELVEGKALGELLKSGPLTPESCLALLRRIASGLAAAHERGIVHRDISPDNIIIPAGDVSRARIIDFGIARSMRIGEGTVIGSGFAGKYNYVSPEQLGLFGGDVTGQSDMYSLGLVILQCLLGRPVDMGGSQAEIIEKRRVVPDLSKIDPRLRPFLERMLQPRPSDRPASMAEIAAWTLPAASAKAARSSRPASPGTIPSEAHARGAGLWVAAAAAVLVVVGVAGAGFWLYAPVADKPKEIPSARLDPSLAAPPAQAPAPAPGDDATLAPSPQPGPALAPASAASPAPVATPPEPAPVQQAAAQAGPAQPDLRRRILTYLRDYAGGDCAIILPALVTSSSAELDGYGSDVKPFELFDEAFKKSNGLEARVGVRLIPPAQCPAIGFANRLQNRSENALKVSVASDRLAAGQALDGSVENAGGPLYLLIVDDEGKVHDASGQLRRDGDRATFRMKLDRPRGAPARGPILLMAVAGADIAALKGLAGAPGAAAFRDALAQAKSSPDIAVGFRQVALE